MPPLEVVSGKNFVPSCLSTMLNRSINMRPPPPLAPWHVSDPRDVARRRYICSLTIWPFTTPIQCASCANRCRKDPFVMNTYDVRSSCVYHPLCTICDSCHVHCDMSYYASILDTGSTFTTMCLDNLRSIGHCFQQGKRVFIPSVGAWKLAPNDNTEPTNV